MEGDGRVIAHVLGQLLRRASVGHTEAQVAAGRENIGDQGSAGVGAAGESLPPAGVDLHHAAGQAVPLAVQQPDDDALWRRWVLGWPVRQAGQVGGVVAVDGDAAKAGVRAKVRSGCLPFAVQRRLPFLEKGHLLRTAAGCAVRCLESHQDQAGFGHHVGVGDLVLVETDQAVPLAAVGRAGEVPVAHDHHLVEVQVDDVLVHRLDRPCDRVGNRRIPVEADRDRQIQLSGQEATGTLVERQQVLEIGFALRLRRLHVEDHTVELRRGVGGVVGDDLGHALQGPCRRIAPDRRPVGVAVGRPHGKSLDVRLANQVSDVAVFVHPAPGVVEARAIDAKIEVGHPADRAALHQGIARGQSTDLIGEDPETLNLAICTCCLSVRETHGSQDDQDEQCQHG